ncbi:DUF6221 family protein [Streptomyces sp. NBUA17]|uniref:DUF6221 family protein n=1 Tax=Streptomyces sp. NBUA17 TaxID=3062275 RepID=UPI0037D9F4E1
MNDEFLQWLRKQLDDDEQKAFTAGDTLGERMLLRWTAVGSAVEVDGMRSTGELPVVTNRSMEGMPGYEVERARALHIENHDPDRVMGEVAAKRKIIARYEQAQQLSESGAGNGAEAMRAGLLYCLMAHATVYEDRPGYREEWRP